MSQIKINLEVDGEIHLNDQAKEYDDARSGELEKLGVNIFRFTNEEVLNNQELVLNKIINKIAELSSPALLGAGDRRG